MPPFSGLFWRVAGRRWIGGRVGRGRPLASALCALWRWPRIGGPIMIGMHEPSPWWTPARHLDRKPFLLARSSITKALRAWFDEQGFAEVETGILQVSPGNETHLHAPRTELLRTDGSR